MQAKVAAVTKGTHGSLNIRGLSHRMDLTERHQLLGGGWFPPLERATSPTGTIAARQPVNWP